MNIADLAVANALAAARAADPTKAQSTRDPFIPPGRHELILAEISPDMGEDDKKRPKVKIWVRFLVESSTQPALDCPIMVAQCFDLTKTPKYDSQSSDADRFTLLLMQMSGLPNDLHLGDNSKLLRLYTDVIKDRVNDQVLRGKQVSAYGHFAKPVDGVSYFAGNNGHECYNEKGKVKDRWVNVDYTYKPTSAEDVLALRGYLDENFPIRKRTERKEESSASAGAAGTVDSRPPPKGSSVLERLRAARGA